MMFATRAPQHIEPATVDVDTMARHIACVFIDKEKQADAGFRSAYDMKPVCTSKFYTWARGAGQHDFKQCVEDLLSRKTM